MRVSHKGNECGNRKQLCKPIEPDITTMSTAQKKAHSVAGKLSLPAVDRQLNNELNSNGCFLMGSCPDTKTILIPLVDSKCHQNEPE